MSLYFIDFENVSDSGLNGMKMLTPQDRVIIFYGQNARTIPFERLIEITSCGAVLEFIRANKIAKNYLDFQLTSYLGYLIGSGYHGDIYIISKDTGFDAVVDFWNTRNVKVIRQDAIRIEEKKSVRKRNTKEKAGSKTSSRSKKTGKEKVPEVVDQVINEEKDIIETVQSEVVPVEDVKKEIEEVQEVSVVSSEETLAPKEEEKEVIVEKVPEKAPKKAGRKSPSLPESVRKKIRVAIKDEKLASTNYTKIYGYFDDFQNFSQMENILLKSFGAVKGRRMSDKLEAIFVHYKQGLS